MKFSIGISPCPNDTFIFDHMLHHPKDDIQWDIHHEDVETLNAWALEGRLDITKLSFATYLQVKDKYTLLESGSALGKGVGPILVSKTPVSLKDGDNLQGYLQDKKIAIPGKFTTANLLLSLAFPNATNKEEVLFHNIEQQVLDEHADIGLLIHESRFTYQDKGLYPVLDLGTWWEATYHCPIPLGGICIKNEYAAAWKNKIESLIQESLQNSWDAYPLLSAYIQAHAQEMSPAVMRQHIELYVNDETMQLSEAGKQAIDQLAQVKIY